MIALAPASAEGLAIQTPVGKAAKKSLRPRVAKSPRDLDENPWRLRKPPVALLAVLTVINRAVTGLAGIIAPMADDRSKGLPTGG